MSHMHMPHMHTCLHGARCRMLTPLTAGAAKALRAGAAPSR